MTNLRKFLLTTLLLASVALVPWLSADGPSPSTYAEGFVHVAHQEKEANKPTQVYFGVTACTGCHDNKISKQDNFLCACNEVEIWKKDKHKNANRVLKGKLGQQMARLLPEIKGDISQAKECISCHGVLVEDSKLIVTEEPGKFNLEEGVSCVACHGPFQEWVKEHTDIMFPNGGKWRELPRHVKEKQYGMKDLWDPENQATLCASCHIGNTAEKKVVTHAMYAAGHPPLPGFELSTFSDAMPRHWNTFDQKWKYVVDKNLAEKSPKLVKALQKVTGRDADDKNLERTRLVVIAGVVNFRESLKLIGSQAAVVDNEKKSTWPELAQFDCYACHHDLKTFAKSWRQERGYGGVRPGRPTMRPWPTVMIEAGILQASRTEPGNAKEFRKKLSAEFSARMKELSGVFHDQPFGDPQRISRAAHNMEIWTDGLLARLKASQFDRAAGRDIVNVFGKQSTRLLDFDSARELTWAFRSIQDELDAGFTKEHLQIFDELDKQLKLGLAPEGKEIAGDYLRESLEKLSNFEPQQFSKTFGQLIQSAEKPLK
jgi:hypothetical protein